MSHSLESPLPDLQMILHTKDKIRINSYLCMADISDKIDPDQHGNLRGSSTTHYLVKLLDFVLKGLDQPKKLAVITLIDR